MRYGAAPLVVGMLMGALVWAVVADIITGGLAMVLLFLNLPAFIVGLVANGNVHHPSGVVWVLAAAVQWACLTGLVTRRGPHGVPPESPTQP